MEIYLIRHTTPDIAKGICYGQSDIPLPNSFNAESNRLKSQLRKKVDHVISSPLTRCSTLADKLFGNFEIDERLKELNFGDWELKEWSDIPQNEIAPWMTDFVTTPAPNGESYKDLSKRTSLLIEELRVKSYQSVALVCHAGPIRAMIANTINLSLKDSFKLQIGYGSVSCIKLSEFEDQLIFMNKK